MSLTLFAEVGCTGQSKELKESEVGKSQYFMDCLLLCFGKVSIAYCYHFQVNITKVGVKFPVRSALVSGNPWILFSEERFQSFLAFLEEGRYEDLGDRGLPADYKVDT